MDGIVLEGDSWFWGAGVSTLLWRPQPATNAAAVARYAACLIDRCMGASSFEMWFVQWALLQVGAAAVPEGAGDFWLEPVNHASKSHGSGYLAGTVPQRAPTPNYRQTKGPPWRP